MAGIVQIPSRICRNSERGNAVRRRWQTFFLWQIKKIYESSADLIHNVDTFRGEPDAIRTTEGPYFYDPTPWSAIPRIFKRLRLEFQRFTFIEMGAGKGRIVLAASTFPFMGVIGVELSPSLCRIAENNLVTCRYLRRRAKNTRIVNCDATRFAIPVTPLCVFFYNPFNLETMQSVIGNITNSYRQSPRDLYLICVGMSTILPEIERIRTLKLQQAFNVPWGMLIRRSVYIFSVNGA